MHNVRDSCHVLFGLELEVSHSGIDVLKSEYLGFIFNQCEVIMEPLDHTTKINNCNTGFTSKVRGVGLQAGNL